MEQKHPNLVEMESIRAKIDGLVAERNECAFFSEHKKVSELDTKIAEYVSKYTELAEAECFRNLLAQEDPMVAAAKLLRFATIAVKTSKDETTGNQSVKVEDVTRAIDPLKLHKKSVSGIGHEATWPAKVAGFYCNMVAFVAADIGIDPKTVKDCIKMDESARKFNYKLNPAEGARDVAFGALKEDLQDAVTAMIGEGYTVESEDVGFVNRAICALNAKKKHSIKATRDSTFRHVLLDVCSQCINREGYDLVYKTK